MAWRVDWVFPLQYDPDDWVGITACFDVDAHGLLSLHWKSLLFPQTFANISTNLTQLSVGILCFEQRSGMYMIIVQSKNFSKLDEHKINV